MSTEPPTLRDSPVPAGSRSTDLQQLKHHAGDLFRATEQIWNGLAEGDEVKDDVAQIHAASADLLVVLETHMPGPESTVAGGLEDRGHHIRHDLKTPLSTIIGYAEFLLEDEQAPAHPTREEIGAILEAARRLSKEVSSIGRAGTEPTERRGREPDPLITRLWSQAERMLAAPSGTRAPPATNARVLVVDDNEKYRNLLARRLDRRGFGVVTAENGNEALRALHERPPDLAVIDVFMPEMNGFELLATIKADSALAHIPIVMNSAFDEVDCAAQCIQMGADDYLSKPFDPILFNARVDSSLEKKLLRDREQAYLAEISREREKSERLLRNILPVPIAERLKGGEQFIADRFEDVTILFADLVRFTDFASDHEPGAVVGRLNEIFGGFDQIAEGLGLEKIKTSGDAYLLAGGLPLPHEDHAADVARAALAMMKSVERLNIDRGYDFQLRIGIHSGPVIAGVIGFRKFSYDVWGDTVNVASRMESQGEIGCIQVSSATRDRLGDRFSFEARAPLEVKGKGSMCTYWLLERRRASTSGRDRNVERR